MKIIGLFSPIRRSGQTTLGLAIGQNLSRKYRTLFISLDCYGGISKEITTIPWSGDLSDLLYSINNDAKDISTLIGGASGSIGSLDIMPPMDRHYDLISISFEEWRRFLRHIEDQTDYEFVILDMGMNARMPSTVPTTPAATASLTFILTVSPFALSSFR